MGFRFYLPEISASTNDKGVLDIDPIKGCYFGMSKYPNGGCYGACYACRIAMFRGIDFRRSVIRYFKSKGQMDSVAAEIYKNKLPFIRMGTMGDPSYSWNHTLSIAKFVKGCKKKIFIITKHWQRMTDEQICKAGEIGIVFNTSISPLDTEEERIYRLSEYERYKAHGKSCLRIVSCKFNLKNQRGRELNAIQDALFQNNYSLDTPFRVSPSYDLVKQQVIIVEKIMDLNSETYMSRFKPETYLGHCSKCPDLCGAT